MSGQGYQGPLIQVDDCCWRIPKSYKAGMRVDGLIYADEKLIESIRSDHAPEQLARKVARLRPIGVIKG
jgi:tRNA-splicing ligase RtcB